MLKSIASNAKYFLITMFAIAMFAAMPASAQTETTVPASTDNVIHLTSYNWLGANFETNCEAGNAAVVILGGNNAIPSDDQFYGGIGVATPKSIKKLSKDTEFKDTFRVKMAKAMFEQIPGLARITFLEKNNRSVGLNGFGLEIKSNTSWHRVRPQVEAFLDNYYDVVANKEAAEAERLGRAGYLPKTGS